jgi:hypothetical protein
VQTVAELDLARARAAARANQRIDGFVDGVVKQGQGLFAAADGGFAEQHGGGGADQQGADQPEGDLDAVFFEQVVFFLAISLI